MKYIFCLDFDMYLDGQPIKLVYQYIFMSWEGHYKCKESRIKKVEERDPELIFLIPVFFW